MNDNPTQTQTAPEILGSLSIELETGDQSKASQQFQKTTLTVRPPIQETISFETKLEGHQIEWVKKNIEENYDRTRLVNAPLFEEEGVPQFPSREASLNSALKQLTKEQVDYMMKNEINPFTFQIKLVSTSNRLGLARKLINGQPKRMNIPNQQQQDLYIKEKVAQYLATETESKKMEWKWELFQGEQIMKPEAWDNLELSVDVRKKAFKAQLPKGMKGTDLSSLTTRIADALEKGKPLDIKFKDDATDIIDSEQWLVTILDEEGVLIEEKDLFLLGGDFGPIERMVYLLSYKADAQDKAACFRASVNGGIEEAKHL